MAYYRRGKGDASTGAGGGAGERTCSGRLRGGAPAHTGATIVGAPVARNGAKGSPQRQCHRRRCPARAGATVAGAPTRRYDLRRCPAPAGARGRVQATSTCGSRTRAGGCTRGMLDAGLNPDLPTWGIQQLHRRAYPVMLPVLVEVATNPALSADPSLIRARMLEQTQRGGPVPDLATPGGAPGAARRVPHDPAVGRSRPGRGYPGRPEPRPALAGDPGGRPRGTALLEPAARVVVARRDR